MCTLDFERDDDGSKSECTVRRFDRFLGMYSVLEKYLAAFCEGVLSVGHARSRVLFHEGCDESWLAK